MMEGTLVAIGNVGFDQDQLAPQTRKLLNKKACRGAVYSRPFQRTPLHSGGGLDLDLFRLSRRQLPHGERHWSGVDIRSTAITATRTIKTTQNKC